jgi:hypothetical protein
MEMFDAIEKDYGIAAPDLSYATENLNEYNHQIVAADATVTGAMPGRAHKTAGAEAVVTSVSGAPQANGSCVSALYLSGGTIGYRAMLGVSYITPRVLAWMNQVRQMPNLPESLKQYALDVEHYWFHSVPPDGGGVLGSPYTQAPPIWQELQFLACADGAVRPPFDGNNAVLRTSWMPNSYLWLDGKAINLNGTTSASADPVLVGDFKNFSQLPGPGPGAYGSCKSDSGRNGNPWNLTVIATAVGVNPTSAHFCYDENRESDPEAGG